MEDQTSHGRADSSNSAMAGSCTDFGCVTARVLRSDGGSEFAPSCVLRAGMFRPDLCGNLRRVAPEMGAAHVFRESIALAVAQGPRTYKLVTEADQNLV